MAPAQGGYDKVRRLSMKTLDLQTLQFILVPINLANAHWAGAVIDMRTTTLAYLDSCNTQWTTSVSRARC